MDLKMASKSIGEVGGSPPVEDEFTFSGIQRGSLTSIHNSVERIFQVRFLIEGDSLPHFNNEQLWLKLQGSLENVKAAKLFVKGVLNQEEQQEVSYPMSLKCVFCGAGGLFMDCLIRNTSALILIRSSGSLQISGLAKPVVRAYSLITNMIEKLNSSQAKQTEKDSKDLAETLEARRAFKSLVERREDRYTLDLLVLPGSVKEILLNLVHESELVRPMDEAPGLGSCEGNGLLSSPSLGQNENDWFAKELSTTNNDLSPASPLRTNVSGARQQNSHLKGWSQRSEQEASLESEGGLACEKNEQQFLLESFAAMGYSEEAVERVLSRTGSREASLMLDLVQHEQDIINRGVHHNKPCETEHREEENTRVKTEAFPSPGSGHGRDFGVINRLPVESTHQPLVEQQRFTDKEVPELSGKTEPLSKSPSETHSSTWINEPVSVRVSNSQAEVRLLKPPLHSGDSLSPSRRSQPWGSLEVTGQQRFLEGLQTPFKLHLMDHSANPTLRMIIIDGSNVAMSHGLGHFYSCRGIALAVQHFWDRGHREISALLPQWRQKYDPRIKENHYLNELQQLGLVSFTPSREVQGMRINSYDDRLMLQLAEKTDGIIVTNDNLRDLLDESHVWKDIIKKRLLQFTFVGDLFMVPDDPLGRNGPHLDEFLLKPTIHSSPGGARFPLSYPPTHAHTEIQNHPDRTLMGSLDTGLEGSHDEPQHHKPKQRTASETASLRAQLCEVFPGQENMLTLLLQNHPAVNDITDLTNLVLQE